MNQLTFMYGQAQVRTAMKNGQPYWVAKDVCDILEIGNPTDAVNRLDEDEVDSIEVTDSLGRIQRANGVSESGLYSLILGSKKPEAKPFKRWVTHEVLPQIRKTGSYNAIPQTRLEALEAYLLEMKKTAQLEAKIELDRPMVLFAESVQVSKDSVLVADLAKILKQNGIDMGEKRLFTFLRMEGYLIKSGSEYNMPTQRSMDLKIFEIKMGSRNSSDGTIKITRTPKVTGKGQIYFINKFKQNGQVGNEGA